MAREGLRSAECRVVKKRVRRCGGDDVGCEVSAFRSHCMTEILRASRYTRAAAATEADFEEDVRFGCRAGQVSR